MTDADRLRSELARLGIPQRAAAAYQYVVSLARLLALSGQMNSFNQYQHGQVIEVNS